MLLTRRARPLSDSLLPLLTQILLLAFLPCFAVTLRRFHTIATMDVEEPSINLVRCGRVLECCVCERERERQTADEERRGVVFCIRHIVCFVWWCCSCLPSFVRSFRSLHG